MNLPESKTIKIGNVEFPNVKWRTRVVFEYERLTNESYYKIGTKVENQFKLFYCAAKVGSLLSKVEFKYTFEQFLDLTDDHYNDTVNQFSEALFPPKDDKKKAQ